MRHINCRHLASVKLIVFICLLPSFPLGVLAQASCLAEVLFVVTNFVDIFSFVLLIKADMYS